MYLCDVREQSNMKKITSIFITILSLTSVFGQNSFFDPIDTVETPNGTMLIYADRTWCYQEEKDFEGVMNDYVHDMVCNDTAYAYKSYWNNDEVITCTTNDVTLLKDTIWMCVL